MPPVFFRDGVGVAEVVGMVGGKGEAAGTCQHIPGICHGQKLVHRVGLRATTRGTTSLTTVMATSRTTVARAADPRHRLR